MHPLWCQPEVVHWRGALCLFLPSLITKLVSQVVRLLSKAETSMGRMNSGYLTVTIIAPMMEETHTESSIVQSETPMIDREALRTSLQDCVYINQQVCDEITRNRANPGQARTEPSARNTND